ncbi:aldo/keto reductase [Demequina sp. NBRC 110053]|uniref:aldo/keto reductase n=1 Tax=Demequina sp. NBRC 110053 TaxID=1570342 RepID=UPI0009FEB561|nr:aldo/keto reductase [Demequina sp. NBRC 110053]
MLQRTLGERTVSAIGLGGMPMSIEGRPDEARSVATIHAALDAGVTLIDTADAYHLNPGEVGHNESLIGRAVAAYPDAAVRDTVLIATKAGSLRPGDGTWYQNGDPAYLKEAAKASALRLGVDAIGLHQHHRPDPHVPYADSIGALAELLDEGVIRMAGISNANPDQIREANEVLGGRLASVQNQFSPRFTSSYPELELCAQLGVAFLPWSPLGGIRSAGDVGTLHAPFQAVADARGISAQQVVLAWELALAPVVIPIPGASRPSSILDSAGAGEIELTDEEMSALAVTLDG